MSKTKHTPAPWSVDLETGEIKAADEQVTIGTIYGVDDYPCLDDDDDEGVQAWNLECHANARLIAAAPGLLEVLEQLLDIEKTGVSERGRWYMIVYSTETAQKIRAAIAAAKGGTNVTT